MDIFHRFEGVVADAVRAVTGSGQHPVTLEPPRDPAHGDLATNAALALARHAGRPPRELATELAAALARHPDIELATVAGPGFINLRLAPHVWAGEIAAIRSAGAEYGRGEAISALPVNVEYVSANPTGPMHMGHCRGAVVGDALASLLEFAGHPVVREYYVNDAGAQVDVLARSVHRRYRAALGHDDGPIPEGLYPGDYLVPVGEALAAEHGGRFAEAPESDWLGLFRTSAVAAMMDLIRADLALLGVQHDVFTSEAALLAAGAPARAEASLRARDLVHDGTLPPPKGELPDDWEPTELPLFRATLYGDDVDRPIRKSDGTWTYFGVDMANHADKAQRSSALIDVWGADHAGTVKRIQAAVAALTEGRVKLDVALVQMVRLLRAGEPVKMSKRAGNFVTLADVVREVGKDVVRFIMLTKRSDTQLDFDFAKVVEQSRENPVFYVQYAHARLRSAARKAAAEIGALPEPDLSLLDNSELAVAKLAAQWPRTVRQAAAAREPHRVAFFLHDLASAFHALWNRGNDDAAARLVRPDAPHLTAARLALADAVGIVLRCGLGVMGVEPVEELR